MNVNKGHISKIYTVWCWCGQWDHTGMTRQEAAENARAFGYKYTREKGWECHRHKEKADGKSHHD